jgi:hypothetical protein
MGVEIRSSGGKAAGYGSDGRVLFLSVQEFSPPISCITNPVAHPAPNRMFSGALSPKEMCQGRVADDGPRTRIEFKKSRAIPQLAHTSSRRSS